MITPMDTARWLEDWIERGTWRDLARIVRPTDPAPTDEPIVAGPMLRLEDAARKLGVDILDLRGMDRLKHYPFPKWGYFRDDDPKRNIPQRGRARGVLPWKKRTAIMLHKTDVEEMGPHRFLGTPCHDAVANDATIVLCHPSNAYVMGGHAANRFAIHVELADRDGELKPLQVEASHALIRFIVEDRQQHHRGRMAIMAHRQSHSSRTRDPGARIFRQVAVPMMSELDLVLGPVVGSGKPLTQEWLITLDS